jgi:hypothetical protein
MRLRDQPLERKPPAAAPRPLVLGPAMNINPWDQGDSAQLPIMLSLHWSYHRVGLLKIRFDLDPETDLPHIYRHDVNEGEAEDVLVHPGDDRPGREGSRVAMGRPELRAILVFK